MAHLLEMTGIRKTFGALVANDAIDLDVEEGEIHALLGENGAGKTTLMNVLYGLYRPEAGKIRFRGEEVQVSSPRDAIRLGIGMVHQHFMLIPPLTVTENLILGAGGRSPFLGLRAAEREVAALSRRYGLSVDPRAKVWQLPVGSQQRVEILKALYRRALLLILDEPTAVLTPGEVEELFQNLRSLAAQGHGVIFISHKLEEVMAISQRVTVLRAGRKVATVETGKTHPRELTRMMVGRDLLFDVEKGVGSRGGPVLEVRALRARDDRRGEALKSIDLMLRAGEILGIAAVAGNGERELAEVLTGLRKPTGGKVFLLGEDVTNRSPADLIRRGVGHIPEDRHRFGLILDLTVAENAVLELHAAPPFARRGFLDWGSISRFAEGLISDYDVKTWGAQAQARTLSGGNQQKLILAREMARQPKVLVAVHPTRGLDVGATEYVHRQLLSMRAAGTAVLLITPELEELFSLSDRLAVLYEGRMAGVFETGEADVETVGRLMAGARGPGARFSVDAASAMRPPPSGPDPLRGPA